MIRNKSFTLLELIVVVVIIGILVTLALIHYGSYKEQALDKEANANLKLIMAAERIYRMETGSYYPSGSTQPDALNNINANLRLLLSVAANRSWNYLTTADATPATCAQATRNGGNLRTWRIRYSEDNPQQNAICP